MMHECKDYLDGFIDCKPDGWVSTDIDWFHSTKKLRNTSMTMMLMTKFVTF